MVTSRDVNQERQGRAKQRSRSHLKGSLRFQERRAVDANGRIRRRWRSPTEISATQVLQRILRRKAWLEDKVQSINELEAKHDENGDRGTVMPGSASVNDTQEFEAEANDEPSNHSEAEQTLARERREYESEVAAQRADEVSFLATLQRPLQYNAWHPLERELSLRLATVEFLREAMSIDLRERNMRMRRSRLVVTANESRLGPRRAILEEDPTEQIHGLDAAISTLRRNREAARNTFYANASQDIRGLMASSDPPSDPDEEVHARYINAWKYLEIRRREHDEFRYDYAQKLQEQLDGALGDPDIDPAELEKSLKADFADKWFHERTETIRKLKTTEEIFLRRRDIAMERGLTVGGLDYHAVGEDIPEFAGDHPEDKTTASLSPSELQHRDQVGFDREPWIESWLYNVDDSGESVGQAPIAVEETTGVVEDEITIWESLSQRNTLPRARARIDSYQMRCSNVRDDDAPVN